MALSLSETDSVIKVVRASDKHLFIHQNYRFWPEPNHLMEVAQSGILGRIFHIRHYQAKFQRRNDWQTLAKNGGGVLNNTCPHFIDALIQLIGAPIKTICGDLQQVASAGDVEDHVSLFLRGENGVTANMEVTNAQNVAIPLPKWILCGTHGTLTSDGVTSTIRYFDPSQVKPLEVLDAPPRRESSATTIKLTGRRRRSRSRIAPTSGRFMTTCSRCFAKESRCA